MRDWWSARSTKEEVSGVVWRGSIVVCMEVISTRCFSGVEGVARESERWWFGSGRKVGCGGDAPDSLELQMRLIRARGELASLGK